MSKKKNSNIRSFILLLLGQSVSQLGTGMTGFALIIWAYTQTGHVLASSLLAVCSTVPYLIVGLFGGAVADNINKKRIMLVCDAIAATGSLIILLCLISNTLELWILCAVNMLGGLMNAFQNPASQVAVSLLVDKDDYAKAGGIQSTAGALVGILTPVLAAGLLGAAGLQSIIMVDLITFAFAFLTLLLFVKIPDSVSQEQNTSVSDLIKSVKEGLAFVKKEQGILILLLMYSILEFAGAISFDSMYSPLLLARTENNELIVGIVSAFMAAGSIASSVLITVSKQPKKKLPLIYTGSFMCLLGIALFGMGRNIYEWCAVVLFGCFGAPIYQTYQTILIREKVPVDMQGRVFSLKGMITQMLAPTGYVAGALLADYCLEPFMSKARAMQKYMSIFVGTGKGAGIGLIFVFSGFIGIGLLIILGRNRKILSLDQ